ncbi:MAG: GNAT family N-acetyltransferase [Proteobacteria bacterium]|nr:GNAT family N-acetyltransferase [Pseudomonadota bacterium]
MDGHAEIIPKEAPVLEISWDTASRTDWNRCAENAGKVPFEQSWAYGEAIAESGGETRRAVIRRNGKPFALAQIFTKRVGALASIAQLLRGPLFLAPAPSGPEIFETLRLLQEDKPPYPRTLRFWTPDLLRSAENDLMFKRLKWRRVMTGHNTAWLNLSLNTDNLRRRLDGNWRNGLVKAEKQSLQIEASHDEKTIDWLIEHYETLRKSRRFGGPSPALLRSAQRHLTQREDFWVLRALSRREPVAAILLVRHNNSATYVIGWTNEEGRQKNATALLLWQGILELQTTGVRWLDLGGIDTHAAPGIARFKLSLGGDAITLSGTYF